ncbi:hypothetical protein EXIGLDRAFT_744487 [Exidia glandulosa HHB12029]|uniref:Uncharacterized protein n=1 Tax=Exidia glandulosa HHB12029 TaxID=1314781 RepID=A0A165PTE8_EXIGL|nr:hypothetical protein EXIGLDRAFT_744487 [Exidia glandulosa HHB12029]
MNFDSKITTDEVEMSLLRSPPPYPYSDAPPPSFDSLEDSQEIQFPEMFLPRYARTRNGGVLKYRGRQLIPLFYTMVFEDDDNWCTASSKPWSAASRMERRNRKTMLRVLRAQLGRVMKIWYLLIDELANGLHDTYHSFFDDATTATERDLQLLDELDTLYELDRLVSLHIPTWKRICADCACQVCAPDERRKSVMRQFAPMEPEAVVRRVFATL